MSFTLNMQLAASCHEQSKKRDWLFVILNLL